MNWTHPHALAQRAQAASLTVIGLFLVLVGAFFRLQVLDDDQYAQQARRNRLRPVAVPAPRGPIADRHGAILATNGPSYTISIFPASEAALRATLDSMIRFADLDSALVPRVLDRYHRAAGNPVTVLRDAPFAAVAALEERKPSLPGLLIQTEPKRRYPHGPLLAHVLGYVGEISEAELRADRHAGVRLGTLVGRGGLESRYDDRLRGLDGERFIVVDALGRTIADEGADRLPPRPGDTLHTTLDLELQRYIGERFPDGMRGAVVAMDPRNGDVLAMYSAPSFDPNAFVGGVDPELWETIRTATGSPLFNRAVQGTYPPASPWKLVLALTGVQRGVVALDTKMPVTCEGGYQYFNRYFRCWRVRGHGDLTLAEAIQHSCDVYFYQLGLQLGLDTLMADAGRLGFRAPTGIDLPDERTSTFPASTTYFDDLYGPRGWTNAVTLNLSIGQGENDQTLINMVRFYGALAHPDGIAMVPRLVRPEGSAPPGRSLNARPETLAGLRQTLEMVVQRGTAVAARIRDLRIAGKTGTAENSQGPDHGWFIGFAPVEAPEIVVGAIVEFGEHGSDVAPLVTSAIARYLLGSATDADRTVRYVLPADSAPGATPVGDSNDAQ